MSAARSLGDKLGIVEGMRVGLDDPPDEFVGMTLMPVATGVRMYSRIAGNMDLVLGFYHRRAAYEERLPVLRRRIPDDGIIWVAWPEKASGFPTDMSEDVVREVALPTGLVDVDACAIDDVWTALKLVIRDEREGG